MEDHDHDHDLIELENKEESSCSILSPSNLSSSVFLPGSPDEPVPPGFSVVQIPLDGSVRSDLNWAEARIQAQRYIAAGVKILWHIDLGLFEKLEKPLENQTQFLSLTLSLEHFRDSLWQEFSGHTAGVCLYQGMLDFRKNFLWSDVQKQNFSAWLSERFGTIDCFVQETGFPLEAFNSIDIHSFQNHQNGIRLLSLYCRDACADYLGLLSSRLPYDVPALLLLEVESSLSLELEALLLQSEPYAKFLLGIQGSRLPLQQGFVWTAHALQPVRPKNVRIGICLPPVACCQPSHSAGLGACLQTLLSKGMDFKLIAEEDLTVEWDGLDYLFFEPKSLTSQGKRKLQGFVAAGGTVVSLGAETGLYGEIAFQEFMVL